MIKRIVTMLQHVTLKSRFAIHEVELWRGAVVEVVEEDCLGIMQAHHFVETEAVARPQKGVAVSTEKIGLQLPTGSYSVDARAVGPAPR